MGPEPVTGLETATGRMDAPITWPSITAAPIPTPPTAPATAQDIKGQLLCGEPKWLLVDNLPTPTQ